MYPNPQSIDFGVAIKFTNEEKSEFIEYMKEIYGKDSVNLSY